MERHDGRPSSRLKDLVDLVVYATHEKIDGDELATRLRRETSMRGIALPVAFCLPAEWTGTHEKLYGRLVSQTALGESFRTMGDAAEIAGRIVDSAFAGACGGMLWDPETTSWRVKG